MYYFTNHIIKPARNRASYVIPGMMALLVLLMPGCDILDSDEEQKADTPYPTEITPSAQEAIVIESSNEFSFEILQKLAAEAPEKSFFASPLSISMAFGMALNGAGGGTYDEMRDFFGHEGLTNEEINTTFRDLIRTLTELDPQVLMEIANSVWYRQGFEVMQEFLDDNREYFDAEVSELDFGDPEAVDIINGWINDKTNSLIEEMIDEIGRDVVMYLINAIYFKADWAIQFDPDDTRDQPFTTGRGTEAEVPMMQVRDAFPYFRNDSWQVVDLPYGGGNFTFTAFLPRDSENLSDFAGSLSRDEFESITAQLAEDTVTVEMPRFEIDYDYETIMDNLIAMGLEQPFDGRADFSRIHPAEPLVISDVMHRAVITVDEEGSEAAAVTVIEIERTSVGPERKVIRLDRPFLFFIREKTSNTILFTGKYAGPEA